jgi:hypothetical protein
MPAAVQSQAVQSEAGLRMLYEVLLAPEEEDPFCQEKLELLSASGLGTVHYLTQGLETKVGG